AICRTEITIGVYAEPINDFKKNICVMLPWICTYSSIVKNDSDANSYFTMIDGSLSLVLFKEKFNKELIYFEGDYFEMKNDKGVEFYELPNEVVEKFSLENNKIYSGNYKLVKNESTITINFNLK
ncbi:MAG: hypothetical protein ACK5UE_05395, partial [Chitinophagales bacterium]